MPETSFQGVEHIRMTIRGYYSVLRSRGMTIPSLFADLLLLSRSLWTKARTCGGTGVQRAQPTCAKLSSSGLSSLASSGLGSNDDFSIVKELVQETCLFGEVSL